MIQLVIRTDAVPGKLNDLDKFLKEHCAECIKMFGAKSVCVFEDAIVGYPEREIRVEFENLNKLQSMLDSEEWRKDRERLLQYATNITSQIVTSRLCI